jgi:hypothetical protein
MHITYSKISAYLRKKGWNMRAVMEGFSLWIYSCEDEVYHVSVPAAGTQEHYIGQVVSVLSHIEDRNESDIVKEISIL